jgi:nitroreductase
MAFLKLASERYSVRKFSDAPVEKEKLDKILEAGRLAPTACNNQPQSILVLQGREAMEQCSLPYVSSQ